MLWTQNFLYMSSLDSETCFFIMKKLFFEKIIVVTIFVYFFYKENQIINKILKVTLYEKKNIFAKNRVQI